MTAETYNFENILLILFIIDSFNVEDTSLCAVLLITPQNEALMQEFRDLRLDLIHYRSVNVFQIVVISGW